MRTMVIAAHPDDEVLGCGGVITQSARAGNVSIRILGEGVTSRSARRKDADDRLVTLLRSQTMHAAEIMGVEDVLFGGLPDNRFDSVDLLDIVKLVERWVADDEPDRVYTHHPGDLNIDHGLAFRATLTALRPVSGHRVSDLYTFEVPSASEWAHGEINGPFTPNVFVNIEDTLDTKIEALEAYETEVRPYPHPRSATALKAIARRWGTYMGANYAEAFRLIRSFQ